MSQLELFVDPYESEYPSLVREVLTQSSKKTTTCATLTTQNQCVLLCNNVMYIWNYNNKDRLIPHAYKLNLPYTAERRLSSVLVVSPEGCVRFWSEIGKPATDQTVQLNGEVAFSLTLIEATESVHRFLISTTTTTNFYMVEIFHSLNEQNETLTFKSIEMNSPSGIGRRMSMLLFGFSSGKESVRKTIFVRDSLSSRANELDIVVVLSKSLKFFSLTNRALIHEIQIRDLFLESFAQIQENSGELLSPANHSMKIIDAAVYRRGILMLLGVFSAENQNTPQTDFYLGYLKERNEPLKNLDGLVPILLSDYITQLEHKDVLKCNLFVPNDEECVILFPSSILLIRKPTTDNMETSYLDDIGDSILGAESGVSALRRLPQRFDLTFYKKHYDGLKNIISEDSDYSDELFTNAFIYFCNKELKKSKDFIEKLAKESDVNYSDLTVDLAKKFVDRAPTGRDFDPRWSTEEGALTHEQKVWLKEHKSEKSLALISQNLEDKLAHYRMLTLFLRHFNLLSKLNRLVRSFHNRSGVAVLAELGEKLFLAGLIVRWLNGEPMPLAKYGPKLPPSSLITESIRRLGKEFMRKFRHPENSYLTSNDHFFNEVSSFHELIPVVVKAGEKRVNEETVDSKEGDSTKFHGNIILDVCLFLTTIAKGVELAHKQPWAVETPPDSPTWLNQGNLFSCFVRHLNTTLSYLAGNGELENEDENEIYDNDSNEFDGGISDDNNSDKSSQHKQIMSTSGGGGGASKTRLILEQAICLAKFVLSQQNRYQRDNSQVIGKFYEIGRKILALRLAEEFQDFTMLIEYSLKNLSEKENRNALENYKKRFQTENFDLFLFDYYRKKGMVNLLLAEKGNRLNEYLSDHKTINWIRNIDNGEYKKARETLKTMAFETTDPEKKMIELSLCKLCVLCDDVENVDELAELSENIRILSENLKV